MVSVPDLDKRLERSEAQLQEVAKLLSSQEALVQQGVQVQKDLEQLADKQRHFEKNHGDLQKEPSHELSSRTKWN
ncbi:unnamed protein product [Effrenium voratum]|uniref:Uncharacterized protein n=1 Tax=Effrenium voratum TaxID=2562239 RepID=A0AA36JI78_9DINO|nr:unnamed protein product [Effrenium voratum]